MPYGCLPDEFYDDPRVIEAGLAAAGLYACAVTYCARHLTDGRVPKRMLAAWTMTDAEPLAALLRVGLMRERKDGFEVVDYFKVNPSREEVFERKAKAAKAANARWGNSG